jgi:hypothetical protein
MSKHPRVISTLGTSDDLWLLLCKWDKESIAHVTCIDVQTVSLPKEHVKSEGSELNNTRINAVF